MRVVDGENALWLRIVCKIIVVRGFDVYEYVWLDIRPLDDRMLVVESYIFPAFYVYLSAV